MVHLQGVVDQVPNPAPDWHPLRLFRPNPLRSEHLIPLALAAAATLRMKQKKHSLRFITLIAITMASLSSPSPWQIQNALHDASDNPTNVLGHLRAICSSVSRLSLMCSALATADYVYFKLQGSARFANRIQDRESCRHHVHRPCGIIADVCSGI